MLGGKESLRSVRSIQVCVWKPLLAGGGTFKTSTARTQVSEMPSNLSQHSQAPDEHVCVYPSQER